MKAEQLNNEQARLNAMKQYRVINTTPDPAFDDYLKLASFVGAAPIAAISLYDNEVLSVIASIGLSLTTLSYSIAFCTHTVLQPGVFVIPDTLEDERFAKNSMVSRKPKIRFYAGIPLITPDNLVIGSLFIMDTQPRDLSREQCDSLQLVTRQLMNSIELRKNVINLESSVNKRKHVTRVLEARNRDLAAQKSELEQQKNLLEQNADDIAVGNMLYEYASQRFLELFQGLPVACYCYDSTGRIFEWNRAFEQLYGRKAEDTLLFTIWDTICQPSDEDAVKEQIKKVFRGEAIEGIERQDLKSDGSKINILCNTFPIRHPDGAIIGGVSANIDITARIIAEQCLQESELRFRSVTQSAHDAIIITDSSNTIVFWNKGSRQTFGYSDEAIVGQHLALLSPHIFTHPYCDVTNEHESLSNSGFIGKTVEVPCVHKDGHLIPTELSMACWNTGLGEFCSWIIRDISERKQFEEQLQDQMVQINNYSTELEYHKDRLETINKKLEALAKLDGATGLKNHRAFMERLQLEFSRAIRYSTSLSMMLLDIEKFREYNDNYGHPAGDEALKQFAHILSENARKVDFLARYNDDKFVIILPHTDEDGALALANRYHRILSETQWPHEPINVNIGVCTLTDSMLDIQNFINALERALHYSKIEADSYVMHARDLPLPVIVNGRISALTAK